MGGGTDSSSILLGDNFGGDSSLVWKITFRIRNFTRLIVIRFILLTGELVPKSVVDVVTIVGDVVDVKEVVSIVVKEENVLIRLLRLLEKVILPSKKTENNE